MSIGNKKYYTIGEIATLTGVKQSVLRFWEEQFDELSPVKNKFGHRVYTDNDIEIVLKIKQKLYDDGLTIKGAKKKLNIKKPSDKSYDLKEELNDILKLLRSIKQ